MEIRHKYNMEMDADELLFVRYEGGQPYRALPVQLEWVEFNHGTLPSATMSFDRSELLELALVAVARRFHSYSALPRRVPPQPRTAPSEDPRQRLLAQMAALYDRLLALLEKEGK